MAQLQEPFLAKSESIGDYNAGCISGAEALPLSSPGIQVMRPSRKRYFGHPSLIKFIVELGQYMSQKKLGTLRIGDLSQARGGPMLSGHASHQTGLDADIWFKPLRQTELQAMKWHDLEALAAPSMVLKDNTLDPKHWNVNRGELLRHIAQRAEIERVFIHPAIKRNLCQKYPKQKWLSKMRAWWGHDQHFHIRMTCPKGNTLCNSQWKLSKRDGCGKDLDWWFTRESKKELEKLVAQRPFRKITLPDRCKLILQK